MKVRIKRKNKSIPLPLYETDGSVGFDIVCAEDKIIESREIKILFTGLVVETPPGYMLMIASRSSTPRKKGLSFPHGIGIVDLDYCGEEDEILIQVINFTDKKVEIKKGEKIAQGVFVRVNKAEWEEVDKMKEKSRGGLGSTDKKSEVMND